MHEGAMTYRDTEATRRTADLLGIRTIFLELSSRG